VSSTAKSKLFDSEVTRFAKSRAFSTKAPRFAKSRYLKKLTFAVVVTNLSFTTQRREKGCPGGETGKKVQNRISPQGRQPRTAVPQKQTARLPGNILFLPSPSTLSGFLIGLRRKL
jgi:hypothetical protein